VFREEAANNNFIVFKLTRPGLVTTIYRILDEHASHYNIDVVIFMIATYSSINIVMTVQTKVLLFQV